MATVKQSLEQFQQILQSLEEERERYRAQKLNLEVQSFTIVEDYTTADIKHSTLQTDTGRLLSRINQLNTEVVTWKISAVSDYIRQLQQIKISAPRSSTPSHLSVQHYHRQLDSDEELSLLQIQLLDFRQFVVSLKRRRQLLNQNLLIKDREGQGLSENDTFPIQRVMVAGTIATMQGRVASFVDHQANEATLFLNEIISPTHGKATENLVSRRVQDYIAECGRYAGDSANPSLDPQGHPVGGHPDRYTAFMEVLVSHLSESYGKILDFTKNDIYIILEDHVMPQVKEFAFPYVRNLEWDQSVTESCQRFRNITLSNLGLKDLEGSSLVPFVEAIAAIKASYFYPNPTRKMLSFVKAAKCVLECLKTQIDPGKIDADLFLDAWVYVLIKANIQDLASTIAFMCQYGNPAFCNAEAGYYLTTSQVAMNFIMALTPDQLAFTNREVFLSCERERFADLCSRKGCPLEVVDSLVTVEGFKVVVMPETASDLKLFVRSVLVETGSDVDKVDLISLRSREGLSEEQASFIHCNFTTPPFNGVKLKDFPHGKVMFLDKQYMEKHELPSTYLFVPTGKSADTVFGDIEYINTLINLASREVAFQHRKTSRQLNGGQPVRVTADVYSHSVRDPVTQSLRSTAPGSMKRVETQTKGVSAAQVTTDYSELLKEGYIHTLEHNFMANFYPQLTACSDVREKVKQVVIEVQVHLQLLNYLSPIHPVSGVYTPATCEAVSHFQDSCGDHIGGSPTEAAGTLTVATRHSLRGRMLEITSLITRMGFPEFPDPLDVSEDNVRAMKVSISRIQVQWGLTGKCRKGLFCAATLTELNRRSKEKLQQKRIHSM
jgi:hypothetical protein